MIAALLLAVDDGIVHGKLDVADILFLIAAVFFGIAALVAFQVKTYYATLIAAGLCLTAIGWLML